MTEPWRHRAACRGKNTDYWFPEKTGPNNHATDLALKICSTCPVTTQCLTWANTKPELEGIWGGQTPQERRGHRLTKTRQIHHGTVTGYQQHFRWGIPVCPDCRAANAAYRAAQRRIAKRRKTRNNLEDSA